jgi:lipoprotein-anchoring transpeptidase ErfK/SrfK
VDIDASSRVRGRLLQVIGWRLLAVLMAALLSAASSLALGQRARPAHRNSKASQHKNSGAAGLDISKINNPDTRDSVGPHSEGEAVVRAAILLGRLRLSPGQISSSYNENLAKAIAAFQSASGLSGMGLVDAATWAALNNDQASGHIERAQQIPQSPGQPAAGQNPKLPDQGNRTAAPAPANSGNAVPAIVPYVVTMEEVAGKFTKIPVVTGRNTGEERMLREARLERLNFRSPLDLLAEKFHSSPRLLVQLNPHKRFDKPGEQLQVPNIGISAPPPAGSIVVDASTRSVTVLDGSGKALAFYPATVGSEHDPLPVGNWNVAEVNWYPHFKYDPTLFWDSKNKHPRATLAPGPRNPVGVVWIGLSKEHYGIHGTPAPSEVGQTQSHGCIRLTNWDAADLAKMVHPGTPVVLQQGSPAELKAPS